MKYRITFKQPSDQNTLWFDIVPDARRAMMAITLLRKTFLFCTVYVKPLDPRGYPVEHEAMMDIPTARRRFRLVAEALAYDKSPSNPLYVALGEYLSATMDAWACNRIRDDDMIENTMDIEKFLTNKQIPD